ncbi:MAG: hypothetical protein WA970_15175, partial [Gammaproteobacteria bacterium]
MRGQREDEARARHVRTSGDERSRRHYHIRVVDKRPDVDAPTPSRVDGGRTVQSQAECDFFGEAAAGNDCRESDGLRRWHPLTRCGLERFRGRPEDVSDRRREI